MGRLHLAAPLALAGAWLAAPPPALPRAAAARFDAGRALAHARALCACGPRPPGSPCHARARAYLLRHLPGARLVSGSVVWGGDAVILGAHYDTVPGSPGAADDAAGAGIVLEAARALGERSGLGLAVWDGEETGLTGSAAHARAVPRARAAIALDLVGWADGRLVAHTFRSGGRIAPGALLARALAAGAAHGDPLIAPLYQAVVRSAAVPFGADDISFRRAGVPALFLSDSSFTRFYPHYHRPTDVPARLGAAAIARAGRAAVALVDSLLARPLDGAGPRYVVVGGRVVGPLGAAALALALALPLLGARRRFAIPLACAFALACARDPATALIALGLPVWSAGFGPRAARAAGLLAPLALAALLAAAEARFGGRFALAPDPILALGAGAALALCLIGLLGHTNVRRDA